MGRFPFRPQCVRSSMIASVYVVLLLPFAAQQALGAAQKPKVTNGGYLQTTSRKGKAVVLPLKQTKVDAEVSGIVASVQVTQVFHNPYRKPIEAVYVFPLPHRSAIYAMTIQVGQRVITGVVKKRAEAKQIYARAKAQGKTAALLEQERPNIFTQSIANIMPGEEIKVSLRYVEDLFPQQGRYEFVFPMVVGPRYVGGGEKLGVSQGTGWGKDTTRIPDASRITPRLLAKGLRPGHDIQVKLRVRGGSTVQQVQVVAHQAKVTTNTATTLVELSPRDAIPNKDFVVRYQLAGQRPQASLLTHHDDRGGHFLLMLQPQATLTKADIAPREYVFVLDVSGSMSGFPLTQSTALVRRCLANLGPRDTFQLIQFESGVATFAPRAVPATTTNIRAAESWLEHLSGGGGTEFIPALRRALKARRDPARARIVLFMTDGYIGYETEVLKYLRDHAAGINLFAFGIGSSVNRFLIDGMARIGVGRPFYLLNTEQPGAVAEQLFSIISRPSLTNITIDWGTLAVEDMSPHAVPDLFADQPVFVAGRFRQGGQGVVKIKGLLAGQPFIQEVPVTLNEKNSGTNEAVAYLWARRQIADWSDLGAVEPQRLDKMKQQITHTALRYNLMSRYTSFVAVDQVVRNRDGVPTRVDVPLSLPDGVSTRAAPRRAYAGKVRVLGASQGGSAVGTDTEDALGGLIGNQIGEAYGVGGLSLRGTGRGGAGTGEGSIGLGTFGTIGKGGGGGSGVGYGRGSGKLGGRKATSGSIVIQSNQVTVQGALSKDIIRRIIRRHLNEIRYCYRKSQLQKATLEGKVIVQFVISPDGWVVSSKLISSTVKDQPLEQCVVMAVRRWRFPKPAGGGVVVVTYPFLFKP